MLIRLTGEIEFQQTQFGYLIRCVKCSIIIANIREPEETAPSKTVNLGLSWLLSHICLTIWGKCN